MKNKSQISKLALIVALIVVGGLLPGHATTVKVYDGSITVSTTPSLSSTAVIGARLGTWDGTTFTPALAGLAGYYDNDLQELSATISSSDNTSVGIASGVNFALAVYNLNSNSAYSTSAARAILTDANWIMPALTFGVTETIFSLTASTSAAFGGYLWNGGNQVITLIPEPTTFSMVGLGLAALMGCRRRKS